MFFARFVHFYLRLTSGKRGDLDGIRFATSIVIFCYGLPFVFLILSIAFDLNAYFSYIEAHYPGSRNIVAAFLMFGPPIIVFYPIYYYLCSTKAARASQEQFDTVFLARIQNPSNISALAIFLAVWLLGFAVTVGAMFNPLAASLASTILVATYTSIAKKWLGT